MLKLNKDLRKRGSLLVAIIGLGAFEVLGQSNLSDEAETSENSLSYRERLVEVAWKNAQDKGLINNELSVAELEIKKSKRAWLDNIYATGNLNEFTIKGLDNNNDDGAGNPFFPRYNFGVRISLGTFINGSLNTRIAEKNLATVEQQLQNLKRNLTTEVLKQYQDYLMYERLFKMQGDVISDEYSKLLVAEAKFKDGEASLEDYNKSLTAYNDAKLTEVRAERDYIVAKLELENLLGVNLEETR